MALQSSNAAAQIDSISCAGGIESGNPAFVIRLRRGGRRHFGPARLLEQRREAHREPINRKVTLECAPRRETQLPSERTIASAACNCIRQSLRILRRRQQTVQLMVNPFTDAANVRADNYFSQTCRFNDRNRHCFVARWTNESVCSGQQRKRFVVLERFDQFHILQLRGVTTNLFEE